MSNENLIRDVTEELGWDPRIDSAAIAVAADGAGAVTLRGTVGSFHEKWWAGQAAKHVHGVTRVENELTVELLDDREYRDADLRGDVLRALTLDALVPSTVDATVENGYVTLTGTADRQYQREEAERVAAHIRGVVHVFDDIELTPPPAGPVDVEHAIASAFKRNAKLDADKVSVTTSNGTVTLKGTVRSWAERDEAVAAAWAAPGVRQVHDRILVAY
jgi:osmotically-inducible protein OsmY